MYWVSASKLEEDFREGRVDEKEKFKYYLATFVGWYILYQIFFHQGGAFEAKHVLVVAANLAVIILGTILCYRTNRKRDNTDFISRMICLGWPLLIITTISSWTGFLLFSIVVHEPMTPIFDYFRKELDMVSAVSPLFLIVYFLDIRTSLSHIAGEPRTGQSCELAEKIDWYAKRICLLILCGVAIMVIAGSLGLAEPYNFIVSAIFIITLALLLMKMGKRQENTNR